MPGDKQSFITGTVPTSNGGCCYKGTGKEAAAMLVVDSLYVTEEGSLSVLGLR